MIKSRKSKSRKRRKKIKKIKIEDKTIDSNSWPKREKKGIK
jgi:hypothetical protein